MVKKMLILILAVTSSSIECQKQQSSISYNEIIQQQSPTILVNSHDDYFTLTDIPYTYIQVDMLINYNKFPDYKSREGLTKDYYRTLHPVNIIKNKAELSIFQLDLEEFVSDNFLIAKIVLTDRYNKSNSYIIKIKVQE